MGKTKNSFKNNLEQKASIWFDQTDDKLPFDAFGTPDDENKIRDEIFNQINYKINHKSLKLIFLRAAAAVLLVASIGVAFYGYSIQKQTLENKQAWVTYNTGTDLAKTITLSDGSVVVLRAGAELSVSVNFESDSKRSVKLDGGEAYFTVKPDPKRPFVVQSGQISTRVLGTAFNIRNKKSANEVEIAVSHGKVQINDQNKHLADLTKGKVIRYHTQSHSFKVDSINVSYVASWNNSALDLNNVSFKELSYVFEGYYGKELDMEGNDIENLRYTLTISKTASAQSTLKIIAKIHGLFIREQNGKLILYK